jgi:hypothetical protein
MSGLTPIKVVITNPLVQFFDELTRKTEDLDEKIAALLSGLDGAELPQQLKPVSLEELEEKIDRLTARLREASERTRSDEGFFKSIFARVRLKVLTGFYSAGQAWRLSSSGGLEGIRSRLPPARYGENSLKAVIRNRKNEHNALLKELKKQVKPLIGDCALTFFPPEQNQEDLRALAEQLVAKFSATSRDEEKISHKVYEFLLAYMSRDNKNMETCIAFFRGEKNLKALELCESLYQPPTFLNDIPTELVMDILSGFSIKELCLVAGVCRLFRVYAEDDMLWKPIGDIEKTLLMHKENDTRTEKTKTILGLYTQKIYKTGIEKQAEKLVADIKPVNEDCFRKAAETGEVAILEEMCFLLEIDLKNNFEMCRLLTEIIGEKGHCQFLSFIPTKIQQEEAVSILMKLAKHGHYLQLRSFFDTLKKNEMQLVYLLRTEYPSEENTWRAQAEDMFSIKLSDPLGASAVGSGIALCAIKNDHIDIVKWIIDEEKLISSQSQTMRSLFEKAYNLCCEHALKWFLEEKQMTLATEKWEFALASRAAKLGKLGVLKWVIDEKKFLFTSDEMYRLLECAATGGHENVLNWLVGVKKVKIQFPVDITARHLHAKNEEEEWKKIADKAELRTSSSQTLFELIKRLIDLEKKSKKDVSGYLAKNGYFDKLSPKYIGAIFAKYYCFSPTTFAQTRYSTPVSFKFLSSLPFTNCLKKLAYAPQIELFLKVNPILSQDQKIEIVRHHLSGKNPIKDLNDLSTAIFYDRFDFNVIRMAVAKSTGKWGFYESFYHPQKKINYYLLKSKDKGYLFTDIKELESLSSDHWLTLSDEQLKEVIKKKVLDGEFSFLQELCMRLPSITVDFMRSAVLDRFFVPEELAQPGDEDKLFKHPAEGIFYVTAQDPFALTNTAVPAGNSSSSSSRATPRRRSQQNQGRTNSKGFTNPALFEK